MSAAVVLGIAASIGLVVSFGRQIAEWFRGVGRSTVATADGRATRESLLDRSGAPAKGSLAGAGVARPADGSATAVADRGRDAGAGAGATATSGAGAADAAGAAGAADDQPSAIDRLDGMLGEPTAPLTRSDVARAGGAGDPAGRADAAEEGFYLGPPAPDGAATLGGGTGGTGTASGAAAAPPAPPTGPRAPDASRLASLGSFRPTFYWIAHEEDYSGAADTRIYLKNGSVLGRYPAAFVRAAKLEGTAKLRDGRVINVAGGGRFMVATAPYGYGVRGIHLVPFRSIAVDPRHIPIGTRVYIPAARGLPLPDGGVHDGIFYAHDVGGGIKGMRIDLFIAQRRNQALWERAGLRNMAPLQAYRVRD